VAIILPEMQKLLFYKRQQHTVVRLMLDTNVGHVEHCYNPPPPSPLETLMVWHTEWLGRRHVSLIVHCIRQKGMRDIKGLQNGYVWRI